MRKDDASGDKEIRFRISILKRCVDKMERNLKNIDNAKDMNSKMDLLEYSLKSLLPLKDIYNLIRYKNSAVFEFVSKTIVGVIGTAAATIFYVTGSPWLANITRAATTVASVSLNYPSYKKLLEGQIKETNEAIKYLESKLED